MRRSRLKLMVPLLASFALISMSGSARAQEGAQDDSARRAREYIQWFYDGDLDQMWARLSGTFRGAVGSLDGLRATRAQMLAQLGAEKSIESEDLSKVPQGQAFTRIATFEKVPGQLIVQVVFDADSIYGFAIRPRPGLAPTVYAEYRTKTMLQLPMEGEMYVYWGGRTLEQNYHAAARDQRFAYDIMVRRDGASHEGDGSRNEQYYCWGRPILAPGPGVVVEAVDTLPDMVPGQMNPRQPLGNHVIIDHGNGEFSFLAHMHEGSVRVEAGDTVTAGTRLGECGNSGNTTEPHLHYHLQDAPGFGQGAGMPAQFNDYIANGEPVTRGEPVKGQTIRRAGTAGR